MRSASTADCMSGYWSLQASGAPSCADRPMHLAERGRGRRRHSKTANLACPVRPEFGHHAPLDERRPHRRRLALQLRQLLRVFLRQRLGNGREQLRHLHDRALEPAERRRQLRGRCCDRRSRCRTAAAPPPWPRWRRHWCRRAHSAPPARTGGCPRRRSRVVDPRCRWRRNLLRAIHHPSFRAKSGTQARQRQIGSRAWVPAFGGDDDGEGCDRYLGATAQARRPAPRSAPHTPPGRRAPPRCGSAGCTWRGGRSATASRS